LDDEEAVWPGVPVAGAAGSTPAKAPSPGGSTYAVAATEAFTRGKPLSLLWTSAKPSTVTRRPRTWTSLPLGTVLVKRSISENRR
jgi:hypothetical protein